MTLHKWAWFLVMLFLFTGCSLPAEEPVKNLEPALTPEQIFQKLLLLPGASGIEETQGKAIGYAEGVLFARDAVLPLPGGPAILDPLAELVKSAPGVRWEVFVFAATDHGREHDVRLAEQRLVLLREYLERQGVDSGVTYQVSEDQAVPVVIYLLNSAEVLKE